MTTLRSVKWPGLSRRFFHCIEKDETMSQNRSDDQHDLRDEYDFSGGVRGKHHEAYRKGTNVVLLDPDVAEVFKDSTAVNTALRVLVNLAREQAAKK